MVERNLLDLASDFASPKVFNMVRTAYEQKTTKKGNQPPKKRRPPPVPKKKSKSVEGVDHDNVAMSSDSLFSLPLP